MRPPPGARGRGLQSRLSLRKETAARRCFDSFLDFDFVRGEEIRGLAQSRVRTDLVEALFHFEPGKLPAPQEISVQISQIARSIGRQITKGCCLEDSQSVVDMMHALGTLRLAIRQYAASLKLYITRVPLSLIAEDRHQAERASGCKTLRDGRIITRQIRITVEHKKRVAQLGQRFFYSYRRAQQGRAVEGIFYPNPKAASVAKYGLNFLAQVAYAQNNLLNSVRVQQAKLMHNEGLAVDLQQRFWQRLGDRAQARGKSTGENGDGQQR